MKKVLIIPEKKRRGRPSKRPKDDALLIALYEDHTSKEIAEMYAVSPGTVRMWFTNMRKAAEDGR